MNENIRYSQTTITHLFMNINRSWHTINTLLHSSMGVFLVMPYTTCRLLIDTSCRMQVSENKMSFIGKKNKNSKCLFDTNLRQITLIACFTLISLQWRATNNSFWQAGDIQKTPNVLAGSVKNSVNLHVLRVIAIKLCLFLIQGTY